jgi:hypothetical protein
MINVGIGWIEEWNCLAQNILCMFVHRRFPDTCMSQFTVVSTLNIRAINFVKVNVRF